jgi:hypothetical protein
LTDDQGLLAKQYYQAAIECLNTARYQQNHTRKKSAPYFSCCRSLFYVVYSIQTIASLTICAHTLGFSNSQSVMLASAVRIAHSLGIHRLPRFKRASNEVESEASTETIQKELQRRIWQQLAIQDWFSVPFSETYC